MNRLGKQASFATAIVALLLGVMVGASASVFPVRWMDEPESEASAADPGAVVLGGGGISLYPDVVSTRGEAPTSFPNAAVQIVPDAGCSAANRGEIRAGVVQKVNLADPPSQIDVDALCFCRKKTVNVGSPAPSVSYAWNCFNSSSN